VNGDLAPSPGIIWTLIIVVVWLVVLSALVAILWSVELT
jgi:hypothetical protein